VAAPARAKPVAEPEEVLLVDLLQDDPYGLLDDLVLQRRNADRPLPAVRERTPEPGGGGAS